MKGHKFLKVTGIIMIIAAVLSLLLGVVVAGLGALAAGLGAGSGLTAGYYLVLLLTLAGGICELIAGIKGIKYSKSSADSKKCITWGAIVILFSVLGSIINMVNGGSFDVVSLLTGLLVPALYIYGAVLNSKTEDTQSAA